MKDSPYKPTAQFTLHDISVFWSRVKVEGIDDCWIWLGRVGDNGYGRFGHDGRLVHRVSLELEHGDAIPRDLTVDHLCRVRACVNPWHLQVVSRGENVLRGQTLTAANAIKTHCPQGHAYVPDNTTLRCSTSHNRPFRECKTCRRARDQQRWSERQRMLGICCHCGKPTETKRFKGCARCRERLRLASARCRAAKQFLDEYEAATLPRS